MSFESLKVAYEAKVKALASVLGVSVQTIAPCPKMEWDKSDMREKAPYIEIAKKQLAAIGITEPVKEEHESAALAAEAEAKVKADLAAEVEAKADAVAEDLKADNVI